MAFLKSATLIFSGAKTQGWRKSGQASGVCSFGKLRQMKVDNCATFHKKTDP